MAGRIFGEIPGYPLGAAFPSRTALNKAGVHRPTMAGISGTAAEGADSVVVNGGYEDDADFGDEIIYTGAGGNDTNTKRQVADQTLKNSGNAGLVTSELRALPVRVIRGSRGDPSYSPKVGYRYDGLYRVDGHWSARGQSGYLVWQFRLLKIASTEAAPFLPESILPTGSLRPGTVVGTT